MTPPRSIALLLVVAAAVFAAVSAIPAGRDGGLQEMSRKAPTALTAPTTVRTPPSLLFVMLCYLFI